MSKIFLFFMIVPLMLGVSCARAEDRMLSPVRAAAPEAGVQKLALVIGNADYRDAPLKNPVRDAHAMADKLRELGFEVIEYENLRLKQIGRVVGEFRSRLQPGAEALFFYAGHGLQVNGENYFPAVDNEIETEDDIPVQSLDLNKIMNVMYQARTRLNLVFLDACRNNPFGNRRGFRSLGGGGLAAKEPPASGTLISYATSPGSVAQDGEGQNGLYTLNLLKAMDIPNMPIELALKRVVTGVKQGSRGLQEPWTTGSIEGDFYFRGGPQPTGSNDQALKEQEEKIKKISEELERQREQTRMAEETARQKELERQRDLDRQRELERQRERDRRRDDDRPKAIFVPPVM